MYTLPRMMNPYIPLTPETLAVPYFFFFFPAADQPLLSEEFLRTALIGQIFGLTAAIPMHIHATRLRRALIQSALDPKASIEQIATLAKKYQKFYKLPIPIYLLGALLPPAIFLLKRLKESS